MIRKYDYSDSVDVSPPGKNKRAVLPVIRLLLDAIFGITDVENASPKTNLSELIATG